MGNSFTKGFSGKSADEPTEMHEQADRIVRFGGQCDGRSSPIIRPSKEWFNCVISVVQPAQSRGGWKATRPRARPRRNAVRGRGAPLRQLAPNQKALGGEAAQLGVRFCIAKLFFIIRQAIFQRRGLGIQRAQRLQSESFFDRLENRKRVVLRVVHKTALG